MHFSVITLFPEMLDAVKNGIIGKAIDKNLIKLDCFNPRDFSESKHKTVDDKPYGGGPGMVMMAAPIDQAIKQAKNCNPAAKVIYLSPQGKQFTHKQAHSAVETPGLIFIAGRYEGIDQRIIDHYVDEEWSIGDYVLSGGELAAMVIIDAISRQVPGVVGDHKSVISDTFYAGLLKYPQYTRPEVYEGKAVPTVLLSGDHQAIAAWRKQQSLDITRRKRPDMAAKLKDIDLDVHIGAKK